MSIFARGFLSEDITDTKIYAWEVDTANMLGEFTLRAGEESFSLYYYLGKKGNLQPRLKELDVLIRELSQFREHLYKETSSSPLSERDDVPF